MSIKDTPRWVTNTDAALEDAVAAGHASVEDAERSARREMRAESTVRIFRDGHAITAEVEGPGRFSLEKVLEAAGAAQGWRFRGSEGDAGSSRSVWWFDVDDPTPALRVAAEAIRAQGPAMVIIGRDEDGVVEYA
jgi:hypothetical protein